MNLYLLEQDHVGGYDTYDSVVVIAEDAEAARVMIPDTNSVRYGAWTDDPSKVMVTYLGTSADPVPGVILASFNAG